jgi:hypothetical protein
MERHVCENSVRVPLVVAVLAVVSAVSAWAAVAEAPAAFGAVDAPEGTYAPPPCTGTYFLDVTCTTPFDAWIEQFVRDGITAGCGGGNYCPDGSVTRAQMAVFVEKAMRGTATWPPRVSQVHAVLNPDGSVSPTASGDALRAAIAAIPAAGGAAPGLDNPWEVILGPGKYDIGSQTLVIPRYVTVEGAGRDLTSIVGNGGTTVQAGPVLGGIALRNLAVLSQTTSAGSVALHVKGDLAVLEGVYLYAYSASSFSYALWVEGGDAYGERSYLLAGGPQSYGMVISGAPASNSSGFRDSWVEAGSFAVHATDRSVRLASTVINGALGKFGTASFHCFQNFNGAFDAAVTCP